MDINRERLQKNLEGLSAIGRNQHGGIDRALGSEADRMARKWLVEHWTKNLGLPVRIDSIANLWARLEGTQALPPLVIGSHHDAVPNGGMYDGALGVLVATELVQTLQETGRRTRHPVEMVSFTGEEPNPFNVSTLGSKVLSGRLKKDELMALKNLEDGSSLQECIEKIGGDITKADEVLIRSGDIRAFIECHIEQGRRLYDRNLAVASVSCITGIYRENITVCGDANHGGTTVMGDRRDALLGACLLNLAFEKILKDIDSEEVVGTIGYLRVFPNAANIIPGEVELVLELRTCDPDMKSRILAVLSEQVEKIEASRKVKILRKPNLDQPAMPLDPMVMDAVNRGIAAAGEPEISLISMAGHDAANMQRVTRSGMVFVQSIEGKSHCPGENTGMDEIETAAKAMLEALLILDKELD